MKSCIQEALNGNPGSISLKLHDSCTITTSKILTQPITTCPQDPSATHHLVLVCCTELAILIEK
ncbi:hypothetical protein SLEP1_g15990 [Rubroshorea leprosula]|uniref:Uncharacterized protein n=1 Tax=Rubroshorea leprosula TaxID=152421 RepID=A0AAV5IYL5_9ROSI|nr:hypothetical protein SLEP1_g15990 [Rubroshorea leprosula]